MRNLIVDTHFNHICIECSDQRQGKYQHTSHNVKNHPYTVLLSVNVNKYAIDSDLKISSCITHIFFMNTEISDANFRRKPRLKGNDSGNPLGYE